VAVEMRNINSGILTEAEEASLTDSLEMEWKGEDRVKVVPKFLL
jgi:hypothetical protein